jgi:hypothetical protein
LQRHLAEKMPWHSAEKNANFFGQQATGSSTVVEHLPHHHKVKGSSPVVDAGSSIEKTVIMGSQK